MMKGAHGQLSLEPPQPYPMAAWDIEIATETPDGGDWAAHRPFGIACAAIAVEDGPTDYHVEFFTNQTPAIASRLLGRLEALAGSHTIIGWNSAGFDFDVLAEESGEHDSCVRLALGHIDLMQLIVVTKGYPKKLADVCAGMGLEGKLTKVALRDGTVMESMHGKDAPRLWADGEHEAVLAYLREDVRATLEVGREARRLRCLQWVTASGRMASAPLPTLHTFKECLGIRMPYQGFLTPPLPSPAASFAWSEKRG